MEEEKRPSEKMISRRNLFKGAGALGAAATAASLSKLPGINGSDGMAYAISEKDSMPVEIAPDYKRMNQKYTVFARCGWDPKFKGLMQMFMGKQHGMIPYNSGEGFTDIDFALHTAVWELEEQIGGFAGAGVQNTGLYSWEGHINPKKKLFSSPEEASKTVKKAAKFMGADLVGIAPYDARWVYTESFHPLTGESAPLEFPFEPKSAIVMAIEMDYDAYRTSPSLISSSATAEGYSTMSTTTHKVATFIRTLGYNAIPCGNDTAMSIPMAIQAGLGEMSRMGMVITPKYGPRVRLCKVFTDLELKADKPITFGVTEFCKVCKKCADNCPSDSISRDTEPSFNAINMSNHPGVKKWYINGETCFKYWAENVDCCNCIASCPYNKIEEWHHDLSKLATQTPARPLLRYFDELFGYGKTFNTQYMTDWWNK